MSAAVLILKILRKVWRSPDGLINHGFEFIGKLGARTPRDPPGPSIGIAKIPGSLFSHSRPRVYISQPQVRKFLHVPPAFNCAPEYCLHNPVVLGGDICWIGHGGNPCSSALFADDLHLLVDYGSALGAHHLRLQYLTILLELKYHEYQPAEYADVRSNLKPTRKTL